MKSLNKSNNKILKFLPLLVMIGLLLSSCERFLEIDTPKSKVQSNLVFESDLSAVSAVEGIYTYLMSTSSFASGRPASIMGLAGLSSDELYNFDEAPEFLDFQDNSLTPSSNYIFGLWESLYNTIYQANAIIEGLNQSSKITVATKDQLLGETYFIRAFCHFYLVNIFGDVPLILSTNYQDNAVVTRTSSEDVYVQILEDLITSQDLLIEEYPTSERVRPNKFVATALLSRVYLYTGDWVNAEIQANSIINSAVYSLESDLNNVFLNSSKEAMWQLMPVAPGYNTFEAYYFLIPSFHKLRDEVVSAFETDDNRLTNWVDISGGFNYPYKYKVQQGTPVTEYSMVFRLAEQYLIRSEARIQLDDITGAQDDLNVIRNRAGLGDTQAAYEVSILLAIEQERLVELFTEWGHRWFDLKRTGRAVSVLGAIKLDFSSKDELYPIPQSEFSKNPKLGRQNPGY